MVLFHGLYCHSAQRIGSDDKARCVVQCALLSRLEWRESWLTVPLWRSLGVRYRYWNFCSRFGTMSLSLPYMHKRAECPSVVNLSQQTLTLMRQTFHTQKFKVWYLRYVPSLGVAYWVTVDCNCITALHGPFWELLSVETTSSCWLLLGSILRTFDFVYVFSKEIKKENNFGHTNPVWFVCTDTPGLNAVSSYPDSNLRN